MNIFTKTSRVFKKKIATFIHPSYNVDAVNWFVIFEHKDIDYLLCPVT